MTQPPPANRSAVRRDPTAVAEWRGRPVRRLLIAAIPGLALAWTVMAILLLSNLIADAEKCLAQAEVQRPACDTLPRF